MLLKFQSFGFSGKLTNTTRAPEARGDRVHLPQNFGDAFTADHKVLSEENESRLQHRYADVVRDVSILIGSGATNEKRNRARDDEKFAKVRAARTETMFLFTQIISLEFIRACEDLCWNHDKSTPYRSETNGITENAVRRVEDGTSALLVQLVFFFSKVVGRSVGMLLLSAEHKRQAGRQKVTVWKKIGHLVQ